MWTIWIAFDCLRLGSNGGEYGYQHSSFTEGGEFRVYMSEFHFLYKGYASLSYFYCLHLLLE
jgi:hypothetical protein